MAALPGGRAWPRSRPTAPRAGTARCWSRRPDRARRWSGWRSCTGWRCPRSSCARRRRSSRSGASASRCSAGERDDIHLLDLPVAVPGRRPRRDAARGGRAALGARARRGDRSSRRRGRAEVAGGPAPRPSGSGATWRALVARFKRDAAAGKLPDLPADELLSANARERLRRAGRRAACASSCSTSATTWCRCGARCCGRCWPRCEPVHVVGLTATNPARADRGRGRAVPRAARRRRLLHPDAGRRARGAPGAVPGARPAVQPLASERDWLAERHARLEALLVELDTPDEPGCRRGSWPGCASGAPRRARSCRGRSSPARQPRLAEAGLRWLQLARRAAARRRAARRAVPGAARRSTTGSCCWTTTRSAACARDAGRRRGARGSTRCR